MKALYLQGFFHVVLYLMLHAFSSCANCTNTSPIMQNRYTNQTVQALDFFSFPHYNKTIKMTAEIKTKNERKRNLYSKGI